MTMAKMKLVLFFYIRFLDIRHWQQTLHRCLEILRVDRNCCTSAWHPTLSMWTHIIVVFLPIDTCHGDLAPRILAKLRSAVP